MDATYIGSVSRVEFKDGTPAGSNAGKTLVPAAYRQTWGPENDRLDSWSTESFYDVGPAPAGGTLTLPIYATAAPRNAPAGAALVVEAVDLGGALDPLDHSAVLFGVEVGRLAWPARGFRGSPTVVLDAIPAGQVIRVRAVIPDGDRYGWSMQLGPIGHVNHPAPTFEANAVEEAEPDPLQLLAEQFGVDINLLRALAALMGAQQQ